MKKLLLNLAFLASLGFTKAQDITTNLVAHYEFTNGSMTDLSGNGNDAVNVGGTITAGVGGNTNEAMNLASGNHIVLPSGILLESNITISLWFKTNQNGAILGHQNTNATSTPRDYVPVAYIRDDGKLKASFYGGRTFYETVVNVNYKDNNWHHLAIVIKGSSQATYIDGIHKGTLNKAHTVVNSASFNQIGRAFTANWASSPNGWSNFFGQIDKVRIYDTWKNSVSVANIYDAEKDGTVVTGLYNTKELEKLTIYPNPASTSISTEIGNIQIIDAQGNVKLNTNSTGTVDVSGLNKGIYVVVQGVKRTKLVIE